MLSHCGFNFAFPLRLGLLSIFHGPAGHSYISLEYVCSGPLSIFMMIILLLGYMGPLLDISPLLYIRFASKFFFPFCRLSFHFVDGFFCNAEAFWLYRVPLVCF